MKTETVDGIVYKYSSDWIYKLEVPEHWLLYWNQVNLINKYHEKNDTILEIGVGSGFTANYLKSKNISVTTFDIDEEKKPDITGNIVTHKFDKRYDMVMAFEVFEHIPFEKFSEILTNLKVVCNKYIILSIPRNEKTWLEIKVRTPLFKWSFRIKTLRHKLTTENHFWEIDYKSYTLKKFIRTVEENGFTLSEKKNVDANYFMVFRKNET